MCDIHKKKLYKYNNISEKIEVQKQAYFFDLEIKSIVFPYLEKLEDSFKNYLIKEIGDKFLDDSIFDIKFLETRKYFNKEKIEELQRKSKNINSEIFFLNLTFGEAVRYFRDLKKKYKRKISEENYNFKSLFIFENWIFSMRYFRNLVCHGENIFNRNFGQKIKGRFLANLLGLKENNNFSSYLVVLEVFNKILGGKSIYLKIFNKQKNSSLLGHISKIEIEGGGVLIKKVYSEFIKNQVFFEENNEKIENKQIFQENELEQLKKIIEKEKQEGKTIVWTNGCFDIMHPGHMRTFEIAKSLGGKDTIVVVGMNGKDSPYWKTKPGRPINDEDFRSKMLANLKNVDYIYIFNDETPARPVSELKPDYVLKGGDYYLGKGIVNSEKGIIKNEKLKYLLNNIENFVKEKNGILDITGIYRYILENDLEEIACKVSGYMPEGFVNVKNGGKVVLVPIVEGCSTTNIVEKIKKLYKK